MKLKHLFFNALAVMAFAACSSEAEEIKPTEKAETSISLDLEIQGNMNTPQEDGLIPTETRRMTLDLSEDYPPFTYQEGISSFVTHCFLRNDEGTAQFYAQVDWEPTVETSGRITLKMKGSTLNLLPTGDLIGKSEAELQALAPQAGQTWYIAGTMGGGVLSEDRTRVDFSYRPALDNNAPAGSVRMPVSFSWKPFTISKAFGQRAPQIAVQFKPQGSLIHIRAQKKAGAADLPYLTDGSRAQVIVGFTSNAYYHQGGLDYTLSDNVVAEPSYNGDWDRSGRLEWGARFRAITPAADTQKGSAFLWLMPRTDIADSQVYSEVYLSSHTGNVLGTTRKSEVITQPFKSGLAYVYFLEYDRPYNPIDLFAKSNVSAESMAGVTSESDPVVAEPQLLASETSTTGSAMLNWATMQAQFNSSTGGSAVINNRRHEIPANYFWEAVLPSSRPLFSNLNTAVTKPETWSTILHNMGKDIRRFGSVESTFYAKSNTLAYAIRFAGGNTNNYYRTAYRYELVTSTPGHEHLKITTRYLGPSFSGSITDVVEDATFWNVNNTDDAVRCFPLTGRINDTDQHIGLGTQTVLYSRTLVSGSHHLFYALFVRAPRVTELFPGSGFDMNQKLPIRLISW